MAATSLVWSMPRAPPQIRAGSLAWGGEGGEAGERAVEELGGSPALDAPHRLDRLGESHDVFVGRIVAVGRHAERLVLPVEVDRHAGVVDAPAGGIGVGGAILPDRHVAGDDQAALVDAVAAHRAEGEAIDFIDEKFSGALGRGFERTGFAIRSARDAGWPVERIGGDRLAVPVLGGGGTHGWAVGVGMDGLSGQVGHRDPDQHEEDASGGEDEDGQEPLGGSVEHDATMNSIRAAVSIIRRPPRDRRRLHRNRLPPGQSGNRKAPFRRTRWRRSGRGARATRKGDSWLRVGPRAG